MQELKSSNYLSIGPSKIVNIDFTLFFPSTGYFLSINMLFEMTVQGQVVPTRMDILPYKYSAFASNNIDPTGPIDVMKIMLVIYTVTVVCQNFKKQKSVFLFSNITDNFIDLMIIFLQTYCFCIKC